MKRSISSSPENGRTMRLLKSSWKQKLTVAVTVFALMFSHTAPALAYGPGDAFGRHNDFRAMLDFRIPMTASQANRSHGPSFGFTVKRNFRFNDPLHETRLGPYQNSQHLTVKAMDLRFGVNGALTGFEVGGLNFVQTRKILNAAESGDEGIPNWVWLVGAAAVVGIVAVVWVSSQENCDDFGFPPENPCTP